MSNAFDLTIVAFEGLGLFVSSVPLLSGSILLWVLVMVIMMFFDWR